METGTPETGCNYREDGRECHKLTESGTLMCPRHNLLTKYKEEAKAAKAAEEMKAENKAREAQRPRKPVRGVKASREQQTYYNQ